MALLAQLYVPSHAARCAQLPVPSELAAGPAEPTWPLLSEEPAAASLGVPHPESQACLAAHLLLTIHSSYDFLRTNNRLDTRITVITNTFLILRMSSLILTTAP